MTPQIERRLAVTALLGIFSLLPGRASAQSVGQTAAWDGLTLSPVGALAPLARVPGDLTTGGSDFSIRYGRWRYDPDDAVHDSFGLTWARRLRFAHARLEITGAYALVECPTCSGSVIGGLDLEWALAQHGARDTSGNSVRTSLGLRASLGGARGIGADPSTAGSTAITLPMNLALPLGRRSSVTFSIQPGFGYGHISNIDFGAGGVLPMFGAAISIHAGPRVALHVGMQRVIIDGGPTQVGAGLSWRLR